MKIEQDASNSNIYPSIRQASDNRLRACHCPEFPPFSISLLNQRCVFNLYYIAKMRSVFLLYSMLLGRNERAGKVWRAYFSIGFLFSRFVAWCSCHGMDRRMNNDNKTKNETKDSHQNGLVSTVSISIAFTIPACCNWTRFLHRHSLSPHHSLCCCCTGLVRSAAALCVSSRCYLVFAFSQ